MSIYRTLDTEGLVAIKEKVLAGLKHCGEGKNAAYLTIRRQRLD